MARRADFVAALRDFDATMAAVAPSPRVEARLRAALRGDRAPGIAARIGEARQDPPIAARMRRPALALLFAVVAAIAIIEGSSDPGLAPPAPSAKTFEPRDDVDQDRESDSDNDKEATPDTDPHPETRIGGCEDPRSGPECGRRAPPIDKESNPSVEELQRPRPAPPAPTNVTPSGRRFFYERGGDPDVVFDAQPVWRPTEIRAGSRADEPRQGSWSTGPWVTRGGASSRSGDEASTPMPKDFWGEYSSSHSESSHPSAHSPGSHSAPPPPAPAEPGTLPLPPPPDPVDGDPCRSPDEWKILAMADCKDQGFELFDTIYWDDCGDGTYKHSAHKCGPPPPDPSESYDVCTAGSLGDGQTCQPPDYWKTTSYQVCAQQGSQLVEFYMAGDCDGGGSTYVKYLCCTPKPPDTGACVPGELGWACMSKDALLDQATAQCAAQGLLVSEINPLKFCEDGSVGYATILCCPQP